MLVDELLPTDQSVQAALPHIRALLERRGVYRLGCVAIDPAADQRSQATGDRVVDVLERGLGDLRTDTDKHLGRRLCRWSDADEDRSIANGVAEVQLALGHEHPRLYLAEHLLDGHERGFANALRLYSYPERKPGRAFSDTPAKDGDYDHAADALRYLVVFSSRERREPWRRASLGVR